MRVLLKTVAWIIGTVTILVAAVFLYLRNADLNAYEGLIEAFLSDAIGLQVDFDGRFELRFARTTTVSAENIRLFNASLGDNSQVLQIQSFDIAIDTWSLVNRPVVIESVSIGGADVTLSRDARGRANWEPAGQTKSPAEDGWEGESPNLNAVVFRRAELESIEFTLEDPNRAGPVRATVQILTIIPRSDGLLEVDLDGIVGDYPVRAEGSVGPLAGLVSGTDIHADLRATMGLMQLSVSGMVAAVRDLEDLSLEVSAEGPEVGHFIDAFALPPFAEGAFAVNGRVTPNAVGNAVVVEGNIGSIQLSIDGTVDALLAPEEVSLNYAISGPESAYIAGLFGVEDATRAAFNVSGGFATDGERIELTDVDIALGRSRLEADGWLQPGDGIPEFDMQIQGNGPNLAVFDPFIDIDGIPAAPYEISGRFMREGDAWLFENLAASIGDINIGANGRVDGPGSPENRISLNIAGPDLSALRQISGIEELPASPFEVTGELRGARGGVRIDSLEARLQDNRLNASGFLSTAEGVVGTGLDIRLRGPEVAGIAVLPELPFVPEGEFDIGGNISVERSQILLSDVTATAGELNATVQGRISRNLPELAIDLDIDLNGPDLSAVLPYPPIDRLGRKSFQLYGNLAGEGQRLAVNDLHALVGNLDIEIDARLDLSDLLASDRIEIYAMAPDAAVLQTVASLEHVPAGPFLLELNVDTTQATYVISDSTIQIGEFGFDLDAEIGKSRPYSGNDISVFFGGPSLREIGLVFGDPYLADEPFDLEAHLDGTETGFEMDTFNFKVGISEISGAMSADVSGRRPAIDVMFESPLIDLRDRIPRLLDDAESGDPAAEPATPANNSGRVFSEAPLDLPWTEIADVRLDIDIDRLLVPTGELTDFHFDVDVTDGNVIVDRFEVNSPQGGVYGRLSLMEEQGVFSVSAALLVDDIRPPVLAAEGLDPLTVPPIDADFRFDGSGQSLHEIVSDSNGHVFVFIDAGQIAVFGSEFFSGGLIEGVARTINPLARSRTYTEVDCGIANIEIVDGVVEFTQVAVQTQQLTTVSSGNIDLDSERLRLTVRTFPREGLGVVSLAGIVNPFIRIAGTLSKPTLEIDPTSSATSAGAAVATGGLSVLARGLWDRIRGGSNMCRNLPRERPE